MRPDTDPNSASSLPASREALSGKSLLIFDDNLRRLEDHPYEYARAVTEMHLALGVKVTIICHRNLEDAERFRHLGAELLPIIDRAIWSGEYRGRGLRGEISAVLQQNLHFAKLLRTHLRNRHYDLVLVPNSILHDAFVWCLLRLGGSMRRIARLAPVLRYHVGIYHGAPNQTLKAWAWRWAFACQRRAVARHRVTYFADSEQLADYYTPIAAFRPQVLPSPRIMPAPRARTSGRRAVVFGSLGNARYDKGSDVFHDAIKLLLTEGRAEGMAFVFQWNRDLDLPRGALYPRDPVLLDSDQVRFIEQPLSSEDYDETFAEIDCFVLPYRRERYAASTSGICVEAACAGKPVIVTSNTWLSAFMIEQGAGIAVDEASPSELADAMVEMAARFEQFEDEARTASPRARAGNSADQFVRLLWGIEGAAAQTVQP